MKTANPSKARSTGPLTPQKGEMPSPSRLMREVLVPLTAIFIAASCFFNPPAAKGQSPDELESLRLRTRQARDLLAHDEHEKGEAALVALAEEASRKFGAEAVTTLKQREELAAALLHVRKFSEAETEFRAVWKLREKVLGIKHPDTLQSHLQLAVSLCSEHKHIEAETEYRAVLATEERIMGPEHLQTLQTCFRLAQCLQMQGRLQDARPFAFRAFDGARRAFGEASVETNPYKMLWSQLKD